MMQGNDIKSFNWTDTVIRIVNHDGAESEFALHELFCLTIKHCSSVYPMNSPTGGKTPVGLVHRTSTTRWQHQLFPVPHILGGKNRHEESYHTQRSNRRRSSVLWQQNVQNVLF